MLQRLRYLLSPLRRYLSKIWRVYLKGWFWETRTRILLGYMLLLVLVMLLALPLMRHQVIAAVDARVREDIRSELVAFDALLSGTLEEVDQANIDLLDEDASRAKFTPQPQTVEEVKTLMEVFLRRQIPEDDTFLIAIADKEYYKSSPRALPDLLRPGQPLLQKLKEIEHDASGTIEVEDPTIGSVIYKVKPVVGNDRILGRLLVVHATFGERQEAFESLQVVIQVLLTLAMLALLLGWWVSGRVLSPLRVLTLTAQRVGESDLSRRIPVYGYGELANLTHTFNDMLGRLETAFQTQRRLLNDAGHELRTPITIIRGHLELMQATDPKDVADTRTLALDELDRMSRLVNELILLAKQEQPDFLHIEPIDVPRLMDELFLKVQALGNRRWQLDEIATVKLYGDRQRITEAILNLADNAVRHTHPNDTIALGSRQRGTDILLWVRDTGRGIALADQTRIFERFVRVANQPRSEGAGLGLAIVKAIAQAHGGTVELVSDLGLGATFTLVLPQRRPH